MIGILLLAPTASDTIDPDAPPGVKGRLSRPSLAGREWSPSFLAAAGMHPEDQRASCEHPKATFGLGATSSQKDSGVHVESPYSRKTYGSMLDEVGAGRGGGQDGWGCRGADGRPWGEMLWVALGGALYRPVSPSIRRHAVHTVTPSHPSLRRAAAATAVTAVTAFRRRARLWRWARR